MLESIGVVQRVWLGREATEPMCTDIRLLSAILDDTVCEQNGYEVFDFVERSSGGVVSGAAFGRLTEPR